MPEAEISPSGTVLVEGHHVGELQGFRFTADQTAGGEDAKAVKAAAQKALGAEFETRAERFSACPNGDIALGSDGVLRWIGAPIATLVEGEDPLRPRTILLADEQLTGPARDKVAARAERFVNFQIDTLLKPLIDLKGADQIAGIGRGVAFQLAENFGLMNRRDIAEDIKALDQEGRAALRRLGVRFGAYHIFVPALVKPAPAGLITLLWALKNDGKDKPGFGDVVNALATGRTSVVIDPTFERTFYKLAGFRSLGRRAVRVDILERLADLIRPALAWKAGVGARPDGAYDGAAFIVTPAMMSILGANADDMEEILKGLGYRAEPKPAAEVKARLESIDSAAREAVIAKAEAERAAAQAAAAASADASADAEVQPASDEEAVVAGDASTEATDAPLEAPVWAPAVEEAPLAASAVADAQTVDASAAAVEQETPAVDTQVEAETDTSVTEATAEAGETADTAASATTDGGEAAPVAEATQEAAAAPAEEPKPILLWRPARFDQRARQRPDHRQRGGQRQATAAPGQQADERQAPEGRRDRGNGAGKPKFNRDRYKGPAKPQGEGGRPDRREGRGQDGKAERSQKPDFQSKPREERPAKVDPLSPFAKLAALRDQLKK